ncbi:MAG: ParB N-terminal domain-containing protein [Rhizobiaceae bacterium]|nr:ParB N-terminal domain-containing protein [Rhizobiaceae bacterium]
MSAAQHRRASLSAAFEEEFLTVDISSLLPTRTLPPTLREGQKFETIASTVKEIGLVEPPVIARIPDNPQQFLLVDGHVRIEILRDMDVHQVECLVAKSDDSFTYNKRVSRLAAIQEHKMIVAAIERGVPDTAIARVLNVNINTIQRKVRMLDGICPEAEDLLKDKHCPMAVFETLRRMVPLRQIEAADFMINANNFSVNYASAILAGTPQHQLVTADKPKRLKGMTPEAMARMERELARLQEQITVVQDSYGQDHLELTVAKGYVTRLLGNPRIVRYLTAHRPEFLSEFQAISEMTTTLPAEAAE